MHRQIFVIATTILVGVIVACATLGLGYSLSVSQSHRTVAGVSEGALEDAEAVLDYVVREIGSLAALAGQPCNEWSRESMELQSYLSPFAREFGIIDAEGLIYCTSGGEQMIYSPEAMAADFERFGIFLALNENPVRHHQSIMVAIPMPGRGAILARVSPQEFRHPSVSRYIGDYSQISLILNDGGLVQIAGDNSMTSRVAQGETAGGITKAADSKNYPMRTVVVSDPAFTWHAFFENLPLIGLSAALAGIGSALLYFRITTRQLSLERALQRAIRRDSQEFQLHYQPVIDLRSGRCEGVEALLRWRHPNRGLIRPDAFIPMAERTGDIIPLTRWVIAKAVDELAPYLHGDAQFHVGINLSGSHFRTLDIVEDLRELIAATALRPGQIVLEATEREILADSDETPMKVMELLSAQGFHIAIDDFGTGHNGLAFLQKFPSHILKIDRTFVDTIGTDAVKRPVLDAIVDLGQRLKMGLVAEGVETEEQAVYLRSKGIQRAQGYHFAKPMPVDDLHRFMADLARNLRHQTLKDVDNVRMLFDAQSATGEGVA
ncbi:MAG: EAL domain-containing protein [Rhodothalassiaceae bacterium]